MPVLIQINGMWKRKPKCLLTFHLVLILVEVIMDDVD